MIEYPQQEDMTEEEWRECQREWALENAADDLEAVASLPPTGEELQAMARAHGLEELPF